MVQDILLLEVVFNTSLMVSLSHNSWDHLVPYTSSSEQECCSRAQFSTTCSIKGAYIASYRPIGPVGTFGRHKNTLEDCGNADDLTMIYNITLEK